ncbi:YheC/YheD family protein [Metabacillus halosaccharovorans]|uniref:YheC/YheD family endospore coat-associated protein n=1 Tax=Metabacillus halosaccharovorans TaxID=930124 RepID=UPI001C1F3EBA|nr:YheC/YheD family protein [Metabacillus halosaccharovorans]
MKCKIILNKSKDKSIYVNNNLFHLLQLDKYSSINLHFGIGKETCRIEIDPTIKNNEIKIPSKVNDFTIPSVFHYEGKFDHGTLVVGPVIGIMGCRDRKYLSKNLLSKLRYRIKNSWKLNGLFFVFAENDVNLVKKEVKGYYFHPRKETWIAKIFPLPNAVMISKNSMSRRAYNYFTNIIGQNVFYSDHLSKWYQYKKLSEHPFLSNYVPKTKKLVNKHLFLKMINEFGAVYLKPNQSYQGKGIIKIEKNGNAYTLMNINGHVKKIFQEHILLNYVTYKMKQKYLIQQAIPFTIGESLIDFRLYLQKDKEKQWDSPGMIARIGKKGSIITNANHRIDVLPSQYAFARYYGLTNNQIFTLQNEVTNIGKKTAEYIEECGHHLGDIAIDLVVDNELKIWILEFQGGYGAEIKERNMPNKLYEKLMITPLEYAKALAGF